MLIGKKAAAILAAREEPFQRRHDRAKPRAKVLFAQV